MSSGRKASLRPRRRSSGKIRLPVTAPQATKLKTMLTKKQICARMTDPPGVSFRLAVLELGALSDLDNITVRIADVAANLSVLGYWLCDELGSSTFPQFIARLDIRNAEIHKAVDVIWVGDAERNHRLIRGRPAPNVQNHPDIRELKVRRRVAVTHGQNASAEDPFVVASRSLDVGHGEKMRDTDPLSRGHLIALSFDLYAAH